MQKLKNTEILERQEELLKKIDTLAEKKTIKRTILKVRKLKKGIGVTVVDIEKNKTLEEKREEILEREELLKKVEIVKPKEEEQDIVKIVENYLKNGKLDKKKKENIMAICNILTGADNNVKKELIDVK